MSGIQEQLRQNAARLPLANGRRTLHYVINSEHFGALALPDDMSKEEARVTLMEYMLASQDTGFKWARVDIDGQEPIVYGSAAVATR